MKFLFTKIVLIVYALYFLTCINGFAGFPKDFVQWTVITFPVLAIVGLEDRE